MIKKILLLLAFGTLMACTLPNPEPVLSPQWFSKIEGDKSTLPIDKVVFSPDDLSTAFSGLKEGTYADTILFTDFVPTLEFEFYDLPDGPGIIFNLRCGAMSKEGFACIPVKNGCKCLAGKDGVDPPAGGEVVHACKLMTEKFTGKKFCEGSCDSTQTCYPLMLYENKVRRSRGVAGCICLPLKRTP